VIVSGVGQRGSSGHESRGVQNVSFYSFCQPAGLLHDTIPTPPTQNEQSRDLLLRDLMASFVLWDIRLEERQERAGGGHRVHKRVFGA
jgi:hypothetical protein